MASGADADTADDSAKSSVRISEQGFFVVSDDASVEERTETDGEEETAVEGVLEDGNREGAGVDVAGSEEDTAGEGEGDGDPVAEDDVHKREGGGADKDEEEGAGAGRDVEQRPVTVEEKSAIEKGLRNNGENGV